MLTLVCDWVRMVSARASVCVLFLLIRAGIEGAL
jgi:hypothetical protein